MINPEKIFENYFDDVKIINYRFFHFSQDARAIINAANGGGDYTDLLTLLDPLISAMALELGELDTDLTLRRGHGLSNKEAMGAFKLTMSSKEGVIADHFGGRTTAGYVQFYPHGITEYSKANKGQMGALTNRVKVAAIANSAVLTAPLVTLLSSFKNLWDTSYADLEAAAGVVKSDINDRSKARVDLELGMLTVIHSIAAKFPGDEETCLTFFNFDKLFRHSHKRIETQEGTLAPQAIGQIANITLTDNDEVSVKNTDANAKFVIYLGATATSEPEIGQGVIVNENKGKRLKPSELGPLSNTFLLVKSLSHVNDGSYRVNIRGVEE